MQLERLEHEKEQWGTLLSVERAQLQLLRSQLRQSEQSDCALKQLGVRVLELAANLETNPDDDYVLTVQVFAAAAAVSGLVIVVVVARGFKYQRDPPVASYSSRKAAQWTNNSKPREHHAP